MRKLLILMLVFGMASLANATVIDVVTVGLGDMGHAGTSEDPLVESEIIEIMIVLNNNPYPGYSTYDGYVIDAFDLDLHVSGAGSLGVVMMLDKFGNPTDVPDLQHHEDLEFWSQPDPLIVDNKIAQLMGGTMGYVFPGEVPLVWNLLIHCDGSGDVLVDLTLNGTTHYFDYWSPLHGEPYTGYPASHDLVAWEKFATEEDLGNLVIHNVPEPATIALLGLGSLFLMRRRRK